MLTFILVIHTHTVSLSACHTQEQQPVSIVFINVCP